MPADQRELSIDEICDQMRADVKEFPEIAKSNISTGQGGGMGGQSMATFEIYGYDFKETDRLAKEFANELKKSDLITQVNISRSDYQPQYRVEFDREKLAMHGLNLSTAATYIRNRYNGALATYYREDGEEYDVKVRYNPEARQSIDDIENIKLIGKNGPISLREVGEDG